MSQIPTDLNGALALNICKSGNQWQASLERSRGSYSIRQGATPTEAIAALFAPALPPPPYQVPA